MTIETADILSMALLLLAPGIVIDSFETLFRHKDFRSGGIFDSRLTRHHLSSGRRPWVQAWWGIVARPPSVLLLAACRGAAGLVWLVPSMPPQLLGLTALGAFLSTTILRKLMPGGQEGADQMAKVVLAAAAGGLLFASPGIALIAVWSVAAHAGLAYIGSAFHKVRLAEWRSGDALARVLSGRLYGSPRWGTQLASRPRLMRVLSWTVMVFEGAMPLAVLLPPEGMYVLLAAGVVFHAANVIALGLHSFFWSFLATYPAIWFVNILTHR